MKEPLLHWDSKPYREACAVFRLSFPNLPTPPSHADACFYTDHLHFLWRAELGDRTFYVYHPDRRPALTGGRRNHGYRIDHNKRYTSTFPNQSQFEHALFTEVGRQLDKLIKQRKAAQ